MLAILVLLDSNFSKIDLAFPKTESKFDFNGMCTVFQVNIYY